MTHDDVLRELLGLDSVLEPDGEGFADVATMFREEAKQLMHERSGKVDSFPEHFGSPTGLICELGTSNRNIELQFAITRGLTKAADDTRVRRLLPRRSPART